MTALTRKHFECIARHLQRRQPTNVAMKPGYHLAITAVANALEEINPRFDRTRFVQACAGLGPNPTIGELHQLQLVEVEAEVTA